MPNVTRDEAIAQFSPGGPTDLIRTAAFGPVRSVAEFYIPFRLFEVDILNRGRHDMRVLALDAVNGSLDLYHFEQLPAPNDVVYLETRNSPPPVLEDARARELMISKVQRMLFSKGFFRMRDLHIYAEPVAGEVCVPYWVAFRGRGAFARVEAIDAIRRRLEGAKVRHLLESWLTSVVAP